MKFVLKDAKKGDIVRVKAGNVYHVGLFVDENEIIQFGLPPIPANKGKKIEVLSSNIDEFSFGQFVEVAELTWKEKLHANSVNKRIALARARLTEGNYNFIHNNCEHFIYQVVFNKNISPQIEQYRKGLSQNDMTYVFVREFDPKGEVTKIYPEKRNKEIELASNPKVKKEKYQSWQLLLKALKSIFYYDENELQFTKALNGKWLCDKCYFSLSHSDNLILVAISSKNVGIDCEKNSDDFFRMEKLHRRALNEAEKSLNKEFIELWTQKEAAYKAYGTKTFVPALIDTTKYAFKTTDYLNNKISITGDILDKVVVYKYSNDKFIRLAKGEFFHDEN